jgi:hypothetical protein
MIISHKYKFIFIKVPKTAGTSLEIFLSQFCGGDDIVTPIYPHVEPHQARNYMGDFDPALDISFRKRWPVKEKVPGMMPPNKFYNHIPAELVRLRIDPKIWNSYFKFCVERNPWDKTLSRFYAHRYRSGGKLTLEKFLEIEKLPVNYSLYTNVNGKIIVDRIIKYENLIPELAEIFAQFGIPFSGTLGVNAKSEYRTDRRPYQEVFSMSQRKIVGRLFKKEIKMFDYKF